MQKCTTTTSYRALHTMINKACLSVPLKEFPAFLFRFPKQPLFFSLAVFNLEKQQRKIHFFFLLARGLLASLHAE